MTATSVHKAEDKTRVTQSSLQSTGTMATEKQYPLLSRNSETAMSDETMQIHTWISSDYGNETLSGWCTEGGCAGAPIISISFVLSTVTLLVNVMAMIVISSDKQLRTTISGILMINMCVAGLLFSAANTLLSFCSFNYLLIDYLPLCFLYLIVNYSNACVVLTSIAAMAVDRFIALQYHMRYNSLATPKKCCVFILFQWIYCIMGNSAPFIMSDLTWCVKRFAGCGYNGSTWPMFILLLSVYLPSIIILAVVYARIWYIIRQMRLHHPNHSGIRTTVLILVGFVVSTTPIAIYIYVAPVHHNHTSIAFLDLCTLMFNANALLSPIIYGGTNRGFKERFKQITSVIVCHHKMRKISIFTPGSTLDRNVPVIKHDTIVTNKYNSTENVTYLDANYNITTIVKEKGSN